MEIVQLNNSHKSMFEDFISREIEVRKLHDDHLWNSIEFISDTRQTTASQLASGTQSPFLCDIAMHDAMTEATDMANEDISHDMKSISESSLFRIRSRRPHSILIIPDILSLKESYNVCSLSLTSL